MARIDQIGAKLVLQAALNPAHGDVDRGIDAVLHRVRGYVAVRFEANHTGGSLKTLSENLCVVRARKIQIAEWNIHARLAVGEGGVGAEGKNGGGGENAKHGDLL